MMRLAPLPADEERRLAALRRYAILDTDREASFDRIAQLAARQFDVPIALVTFLDRDRQWFKATCGLDITEASRELAFCSHTILGDGVLVVPDAGQDERFADHPYVTEGLKLRFYAGAPLVSPDGQSVGTLCLVDSRPRPDFTDREQAILADLAAVVVDQLEMRYATGDVLTEVETRIEVEGELAVAEQQLDLFFEHAPVSVAMFDRDMRFLAASRRWLEVFGIADQAITGSRFYDVAPHLPEAWKSLHRRCLAGESISVEEDVLPTPDGGFHWVRCLLRPWRNSGGQIGGLIAFLEVIDDRKAAAMELERSRGFLEAVLDSIHDGIIACDADGEISLFNDALARICGMDGAASHPAGMSDYYRLLQADGETPLTTEQTPLFSALRGEVVENAEMVIVPRNGEARTVVAQATPMFDTDGRKIGAVASLHDVTRERTAEALWREAQSRYQAIFDHTFEHCWLMDAQGHLIEANNTALRSAGLARTDVVGRPIWETRWWSMREATRDAVKDAVRKASEGTFVRYEAELPSGDDHWAPFDISLKPVRDHRGQVAMLIAEGRDVSERRAVELELRRNKAELELILNSVPIRIFYKDDKNKILRLNAPAAESMGMSIEEVEGRNTYDLFPEMAEKYHTDDLEVIESRQPKLGIVEAYTPVDGDAGWVRTDKVPYTDPETGERFVFVAASDITAEKRADEARRVSEERYQALYSKTPVMLHTIDGDGRILTVSDYWLEKLGYRRDEVIGRRSIDFLTPDSKRKAVDEVFPELIRKGVLKDIEYQFVTRSGDVLDILLSALAENDQDGNFILGTAVLTDITDRKVVEGQLVQAQKMESVGQLTGGLAHDFNNLLGIVLGNLQLIELSIGEDATAKRRIGVAQRAVEKGAELTRRLLTFSRRQKLETTSIDANALIEDMTDLLQRTLGEVIALECNLGEDLPPVRTDPSQLESSLLNLAVNARDAMPSGGALTIETILVVHSGDGPTRDTDLEPGSYVLVTVSDTGVGIPAEEIPKVVEPFFTTKEVGRGTGLGLSMVYGFLKQSGGHLSIQSELGLGTTVRMYLPVDSVGGRPAARRPTKAKEDLAGAETILVVEDQEEVREIAVAMLKDLGYAVLQAADAWSALKLLLADNRVDLLFTDIVMPGGLNGTGLANAARAMRPDLPIVFATGFAEAAVMRQGKVGLSDNLLTKPYRQSDLAFTVRQVLDASRSQDAEVVVQER